jgi:ABC-type oligopeptide transport system, periplasmic component
VRVNDAEPQNPLVPTNTNETGGGRIVDLLFAGLVSYEADGSVKNEVAKSIETDDNQNFTVELEDGWTFSDGSPVTADSFINAWNYGARLGNKQLNSSYYEIIEGFSDEEDRETLTGLEKIDDLTFTIRLKAPSSDLRLRLGMAAFYPLPESAYDDMEAFGAAPIGNGPYSMTTWDHNSQVVLTKSATYQGNRQAQNEGITFVIYTDYDAAYNDLRSNSLDVLDAIPNSALSSFTDDLGDRAINQPGAVIQCFAIRTDVEHWKMDDEGRARRAALSRAINRKQICDTLYYNTRTPASDFTSPAIHGWTDRVPGNEVLQYDETEAKNQWANAEAIAQY